VLVSFYPALTCNGDKVPRPTPALESSAVSIAHCSAGVTFLRVFVDFIFVHEIVGNVSEKMQQIYWISLSFPTNASAGLAR
jgi:hypothetical protein